MLPKLKHQKRTKELELGRFQRTVLIYRAVVYVNGGWRRRTNVELRTLYKYLDVVDVVKFSRLQWAGHVARKNPEEILFKPLSEKLFGARKVGRPRP